MSDLERAKSILSAGGCTLALVNGEIALTSAERGVKPLMQLLGEGKDVHGYSAADLVVGKAAAFLYVLLGVKEVYAPVMSAMAAEVLAAHGIGCFGDEIVERIKNRAGDGFCPMETAVEGITDPSEAPAAIKERIAQMRR